MRHWKIIGIDIPKNIFQLYGAANMVKTFE